MTIFGTEIVVSLNYLNGTKDKILITSDIDEINNQKMKFTCKKNDTVVNEIKHASPIIKIENIDQIENVKKIIMNMGLSNFTDLTQFPLKNVEEIIVSWGMILENLKAVENLLQLKILYLNSIEFKTFEDTNLSKTQLEYLEISYSKLKSIKNIQFPTTLKYLNIIGNGIVKFDIQTIENLNKNDVMVISDKEIVGINHQIIGTKYFTELDEKYLRFIP